MDAASSLSMLWRVAVLALAALSLADGEPRRYDGYRVYRVRPNSEDDVNFLNEFASKHLEDMDFWVDATVPNKTADVFVSPEMQSSYLRALQQKGIESSVFIEDVQKLIDMERPNRTSKGFYGWHAYQSMEDIYAWLASLPQKFPRLVTRVVAGWSYERLDIVGVKISYGPNRPIVFIEGTIHAREWISAAAVSWFINEILTSQDAAVRSIVEKFDFYIFPVTNPDGYRFSWTDERMWRKTLQPHPPCFGADANRNWDYRWLEEGASTDPCSNKYAGHKPFGEVETALLSKFITSLGSNLLVYLSFHSYKQLLMYPYGSSHDVPDNNDELRKMAQKAVLALRSRYGTDYGYGNIASAIYPATGSSLDWVKMKLGTRFTFVWELRDTGEYGFLLPPEQIIPTSEETFDSVLCILKDVCAAIGCK